MNAADLISNAPTRLGSVRMLRKAVIPAAGLGTRLLPMTKEMPKEMFPIFMDGNNGSICLKPMVQAVYEQLFDNGFRDFCIIVGRTKRAIEDQFTPDSSYVDDLRRNGRNGVIEALLAFYRRVYSSDIVFVNQPEPKGFGDAVYAAHSSISEGFLVHAGDTYIVSKEHDHIRRLLATHQRLGADATFLVQPISDPRQYGVIRGKEVSEDTIRVEEAVEKPEKPVSNLAIMPVYAFEPVIFEALSSVKPGKGGEVQLTDGIQTLIDWGCKVNAVKLNQFELRLDIGMPDSCWEALKTSYEHYSRLVNSRMQAAEMAST